MRVSSVDPFPPGPLVVDCIQLDFLGEVAPAGGTLGNFLPSDQKSKLIALLNFGE